MKIISPKRLLTNVFQTVRNGDIFANSSLDLPFARTKTLDPRVSFTRASSGTFIGSDGLIQTATTNEPRFDHNPTTGESLGLLVEEARTNLYQYSEEFDNAYWSKPNLNGTVTANQIASPDGAVTADLYQEDTATSGRYLAKGMSLTSGTVYTVSVWAKQAAGATRYLGFIMPISGFGVNVNCTYILSGAGTASINTSGTSTTASIQAFANGWYRCTLTSQATATGSTAIQFRLSNSSTNASASYTGDGTSGIYLWGAQLEAGAFPTSYIPTTTATVTRAADVASITGSNFSSWYNQTEGTVFAEASGVNNVSGATRRYLEIRDAGSSDRLILGYQNTTNNRFLVVDGGATVANINVVSLPTAKAAGAYKVNSFQLASNGALGTEDNVGVVPTPDQIQIGSQDGSSVNTFLNGTIKRITYWPTRLADTTLQQITQP